MEITHNEIKSRAVIGLKGIFLRSVWVIFLSFLCILALRGAAFFVAGIEVKNVFLKMLSASFFFFLLSVFEMAAVCRIFCWHYRKVCVPDTKGVSFFKLLMLGYFMSVRILFFGIIFFTPALILNFSVLAIKLSERFNPSDTVLFSLDAITVVLAIFGGLFLIFFMTRYMLCPAILIENCGVSVRVSAKTSVSMMKNEKSGAFCFVISLFPYVFLSLFIIPAIYFLPKTVSSICLFDKYIIEKNRISFPMLSYK